MVMRNLIEATQGENVELIDGIKIYFGKEWVLLFPDQDKPFFNIAAEAETEARAENLMQQFREKIRGWL
jgi:mannose-1-phosphate guanylyltransferase/phosphomannomutase